MLTIISVVSSCSINKRYHQVGFHVETWQAPTKVKSKKEKEVTFIESKTINVTNQLTIERSYYAQVPEKITLNLPKQKNSLQSVTEYKQAKLNYTKQKNNPSLISTDKKEKSKSNTSNPKPISDKTLIAVLLTTGSPIPVAFITSITGGILGGILGFDGSVLGSIFLVSFGIGMFATTAFGVYLLIKALEKTGPNRRYGGASLIYISFIFAAIYTFISLLMILSAGL